MPFELVNKHMSSFGVRYNHAWSMAKQIQESRDMLELRSKAILLKNLLEKK